MVEERASVSRSIGFLAIFSILIFFTVVVATGGLYFYKGVLAKNITKMENDLNLAKNRFEPSKILQLQVLDERLNASSEILRKHIVVSPIFKALQEVTMKTIGYTKFSYYIDDIDGRIVVKMSGMAVGYRSVALQSDLLTKNKNLIDPVFSNLSLDDKGNVLFDLEFSVNPDFVNYKRALEGSGGGFFDASDDENIFY